MLSWIEISSCHLLHNYRVFKELAGDRALAPVLKSNAYGHGLTQTYQILAKANPEWLCVNYVSEGCALRQLGFTGRILVVGPAVTEELPQAHQHQLEVTIGHIDVLKYWKQLKQRPRLHIKIDSGMARQGFLKQDANDVADLLETVKTDVVGISTHFANVEDVTNYEYPNHQLQDFKEAVDVFTLRQFRLLRHAASSASSLLLSNSHFDLIRVGISLYGLWPSQATKLSYLQTFQKLVDLQPVLSWKTTITSCKKVPKDQYIGYGCTYRAFRDMVIAVIPVGYYEGFPRIAGEHSSHVLVRGQRCPVVGRICMNMMMIDVTHIAPVTVGEEVTIIGSQGEETIHASDLAGWAQTIHYELITRIHGDITRKTIK